MASKHSSKSQRTRRNTPDSAPEERKPSYLSPAVIDAIEKERRKLHQAESSLGCLALALQEGCEPDSYDDPDYSDAAGAVRLLIRSVAERLEIEVLLQADQRKVPDE